MIQGAVNAAREAVISLTIQGPSGTTREIEVVIDTGFSEFLTLPTALVSELGLTYITRERMILADGGEAIFENYEVTALWDGAPRHIVVQMADATSLAGMKMLDGYDLRVEFKPGGRVAIQAITEP